jgi:transposase
VIKKDYTHQQAADHLGVSLSAIGRWVRAERGPENDLSKKTNPLRLSDQTELIRLRKENDELRMERETLKKAAENSTRHRNT